MATSRPTNQTALINDQKMQSGISKYFSTLTTLSPKGIVTTPAKLTAIFQADIDQTTELDTLVAQVTEKRALQRAARLLAIQTRTAVKAYIIGNYGDQVSTMRTDFGCPGPKQRSTPSAAAKAQAVVQAEATRKARGTMGPKQKAKVKGVAAAPVPAASPAALAAPVVAAVAAK